MISLRLPARASICSKALMWETIPHQIDWIIFKSHFLRHVPNQPILLAMLKSLIGGPQISMCNPLRVNLRKRRPNKRLNYSNWNHQSKLFKAKKGLRVYTWGLLNQDSNRVKILTCCIRTYSNLWSICRSMTYSGWLKWVDRHLWATKNINLPETRCSSKMQAVRKNRAMAATTVSTNKVMS